MIPIILLAIFLALFYALATRKHSYWADRNVKHDPPVPFFGNHFKNLFGKVSATTLAVDLCDKYPNEKIIGYYKGPVPLLIVQDLDLVRQIINVDFLSFYPRGLGRNKDAEPVFGNLFHADGDSWKLLRQRLTPAFTTAKLRAMFPLVVNCAERLQRVCSAGGVQDARELMARFTTEFIGACGFGIDMDSINNEQSQFRALGKQIFYCGSLRRRVLFLFMELFPDLKKISMYKVVSNEVFDNIRDIVQQIRQQRNFKPAGRHDFIDLLLELEEKGKITGESIENHNPDGSPIPIEMEMDLTCMVAQVFVFFAAGFETSSSATSYTLHELAYNSEVQRAVQEDIDRVMLKYDNQLCYDAVAEMTLLDQAFKEGMRKFPSLGVLNRVCTRRYTLPGTGVTVDPGTHIIIPVQKIHMDERYYDDPKAFRLDRFSPENVKNRHKYAYLPFGEGPRACIGAKLGHMQSMAGLAAILHQFTVEPAPDSKQQLLVNPLANTVQAIDGGISLNFKPRRPNEK